jgi:aminopeptidase N
MRGFVLLLEIGLLAGLTVATQDGFAQERVPRGARKVPGIGSERRTESLADPRVDALHYDLALDLGMKDGSLAGKVSILLRTLSGSVELHAAALQIDSVTINGRQAGWDSAGTEMIRLDPGGTYAPGETLSIDLWYRRLQGVRRPSWRDGYYWFSSDSLLGLPATVGYTMSEPSDARFWIPCNDQPWDKATADISVTVPDGVVAASNGRLIERRSNANGTTTWHWREGHQVAPYLLCVTASAFTVSSLPFVRAAGDTIPLQYYAWREDSASCAAFLPTVRAMMEMLSSRFGPYPFDKYGMTVVVPFAFGGMEHQTLTTMHRALKTDTAVVVHELAHQWWGDLVTCGTWEDIWLNEGFASYSEALWEESRGGPARLNTYLNTAFDDFNNASWEGAIYAPESQGFDLFCSAVYSKAAWVLHTLRGLLGDSVFFRSLLAYRGRYTERNATTDQLQAVVDSVSGRDTRWFFQQWIRGRGWPEYACSWIWRADTLRVTIAQQQRADFWPVFVMPVQLGVSSPRGDTVLTVLDSLRTQEFVLPLDRPPDSLSFDPFNRILKRMTGPVVGGRVDPVARNFVLEQNFPNPFNPVTVIRYAVPSAGQVRLAVHDLLGREVAVLLDGEQEPGTYSTSFDGAGLATGVYVYRLSAGGSFLSKKMILIR